MLHTNGTHFQDTHGRTVLLRGVNLGGSSKLPRQPNGATHLKEHFYNTQTVSFVGRPFPPAEADEHFGRLRAWGFNCLRFLVTWEAIEHGGPGQYDVAYLDYVQKMIAKAGEYGFYVFVDPHQDVWSRWTGGDGAPAWTLEAVGFDIAKLHETGAAFLHQELRMQAEGRRGRGAEGESDYPTMQWVTNYNKLGTATMFSLFFGGRAIAPHTLIEGENAQEYLQRHYINAIKQVAQRVKDMPHVLGYDTLNEPHQGWLGRADLHSRQGLFNQGPAPTPFQSMLLGAGFPQEAAVVTNGLMGERVLYHEVLNPNGVRVWRPGYEDVWQANGVWDVDTAGQPRLLRPDHFTQHGDVAETFVKPFLERFTHEIRAVHPEAIIFAESTLGLGLPQLALPNLVNASHWYDAILLFRRQFNANLGLDSHTQRPILGKSNVAKSFAAQLAQIQREGAEQFGGPTLLGEFGISFDLDDNIGFREGNFSSHISALDRTWQALEANLLSGTLWNYTADNNNAHGDQWNGEDLSIFSRDQIHDLDDPHNLDAGGRATAAFVRPYPRTTAGEPVAMQFDLATRTFTYRFKHDPAATAPTQIFVPNYHYAVGLGVELSDGRCDYDPEAQLLTYHHTAAQAEHTITITREHGPAEVLAGPIQTSSGASYPLEHEFIRTNGVTLHVVLAGPQDGQPVLLLHGFPEFWYGWKYQIPYLVRLGYRVIVPDQRGYNLSDKPKRIKDYALDKLAADAIGLLDALGYPQAHLIGHDWGAMVAWWVAIHYPSRIRKAIILNVPHPAAFQQELRHNPQQMAKSWYAAFFQIPWLNEALAPATDWQLGEMMLRQSGHPDTFTAEDIAQYRAAWARPGALRATLNWYRALVQYRPHLPDPMVRVPLLLIWGAQDVALAREMALPSVRDYCADGRLIFIEEATHWVQHDEPERVNGYIGRFLNG